MEQQRAMCQRYANKHNGRVHVFVYSMLFNVIATPNEYDNYFCILDPGLNFCIQDPLVQLAKLQDTINVTIHFLIKQTMEKVSS